MRTNTTATPNVALTLKEAVVNAVNELKATKGSFSAHDVTSTVRDSVNAGEYTLPGYEARPGTAGGTIKYWVEHEAVRAEVDGLLASGELANLGLTRVEDPNATRAFRLFVFDGPATPATPVTAANQTTTATADDDGNPLSARIKAYLANVGTATLKQVQSALKVNGVTCEDLYNLATALGLNVTEGTPGKFSTYSVG